jgi:hypothetical protein
LAYGSCELLLLLLLPTRVAQVTLTTMCDSHGNRCADNTSLSRDAVITDLLSIYTRNYKEAQSSH